MQSLLHKLSRGLGLGAARPAGATRLPPLLGRLEGVPAKPWAALNAKRRQQLALGAAAGAVTAAAGIGAALVSHRLRRR